MKFTKQLQRGSWGWEVFNLQDVLSRFGHANFAPMLVFGPKTEKALISFQKEHGLKGLGQVGPLTRQVLNDILSSPRETLLWTAVGCLGKDASPEDKAQDDLACAETVWAIINKAFPFGVGFDLTISTAALCASLKKSPLYQQVEEPMPGDIVVSPTGEGTGAFYHGHTGIVGDNNAIMSNDSDTGKFMRNYDIASWDARYKEKGGFGVYYFRRIKF